MKSDNTKKEKISKPLRKPCRRIAMTYVHATRPKGFGIYRNGHRQIEKAIEKDLKQPPPRLIQQSHPHLKYSKKNKSKQSLKTERIKSIGRNHKKKYGKYMFFDWKRLGDDVSEWNPLVCDKDTIDIDRCRTTSFAEKQNNQLFFDETTNNFLFAIISECQSSDNMGGKKRLNKTRQWIESAMKKKPDVSRGKKRCGHNDGYKIFGIRKDPLGNGIGSYCWKQGVGVEEKNHLNACAAAMVKQLEASTHGVEKQLSESNTMKFIRQRNKQKGMDKDICATALSIGCNYWSQSHVDNDFYFTRLTVLAPEDKPHTKYSKEILYFFVFPTYEICVPLRSGDVLLFNPLVLHSCSNPRFKDSYIMSAYVSAKTILCQNSEKMNVEEKY